MAEGRNAHPRIPANPTDGAVVPPTPLVPSGYSVRMYALKVQVAKAAVAAVAATRSSR